MSAATIPASESDRPTRAFIDELPIAEVLRYGEATGRPWQFVYVRLADGTTALTCTDLIDLEG